MNEAVGEREGVALLDVPDHHNIGDAAILLGELAWTSETGRVLHSLWPYRAVSDVSIKAITSSDVAPIMQGGGFFGGLYPRHDLLRLRCIAELADSRLVQAPQSVSFSDDSWRGRYRLALSGTDARLLVRDRASATEIDGLLPVGGGILSPDAAHGLGMLSVEAPQRPVVVLLREDDESVGGAFAFSGEDWPQEQRSRRLLRQIGGIALGRVFPPLTKGLGLQGAASRRLERGLGIISRGEVIVTDRLHVMLLGLQCGRQVIAIDNKVKKLSRYASTWFEGLDSSVLTLVDTAQDAEQLLYARGIRP